MKLEVAVADVSQSKKDLTIEVPADEVRAEFEKAYETFSRHAKVPGFRQGRVPRGVVKQRFGKEIKDEVMGRLLPHALQHAIEDRHLRVVGKPYVDDVSLNEGEPLKFKASIEVMPDFELHSYKGLKGTKRLAKIADEDVDQVIEKWREAGAEFVPVEDRPSEAGDFVSIDVVGTYVDPPDTPELKLENTQLELGANGVQPEFDQNLRGVKAGDVRQFRVAYPENHEGQAFAGKTIDFTVTVVAVRRKELPELDDDFVRGVGDFETVQGAREKVREGLVKDAEHRAGLRLRDQLLEQILKAYDFELPASLVEQEAINRMREVAYMMLRGGVSPELVNTMDWKERLPRARAEAIRDIRAALVVGKIAEAEGVTVTSEELDAEIERMAASSGEPLERLRARLTKEDALSSIENRLVYQRALDLVANNAEITVEELTQAELAQGEESEREDFEPTEAEAGAGEGVQTAETSQP